ncbi:glycosyltransferase family 4 protein [Nesterenkonia alba]|uniref:glycosyltransferase family 4 protein n=1 Tax=Nesterenkonia alba TaxID=515814 RepID=UPI0003B5A445|nr:glycosyltransferase family 4 protein [Nesterenkonia alba]
MGTALWVEPELGVVSGGLRYNAQVRGQLEAAGWFCPVLRRPVEFFTHDDGASAYDTARHRHQPDLVIVDGLIGAQHPQLFSRAGAGQTVHLVHMPAAAASEGLAGMDAETVDETAQRERAALLRADHVVTVSRWCAKELQDRYGRDDVLIAVPGVTVSGTEPRSHFTETAGQARLACVAAFQPVKNHHLLAEALRPLHHLQYRLLLAGPGAQTQYGAEVLARLRDQLGERLQFRGELAPQEVSRLWAETDLLLVPSLVEAYGMVVTEACAAGVPALVAAGTGAQEAAGAAGVALDPRRPAEWTQAIERFLTDPTQRAHLIEAARRRRPHLPSWAETAEVFASLA